MKNTTTAVCTLYEGHYHYGLAAFINSLEKNGFSGDIFVGYKGSIAPWAAQAEKPVATALGESRLLQLKNDLQVHFIEINPPRHFTNQKPFFMCDVWEHLCPDVTRMFYFDPDIVIKCDWTFYEKWVGYGVALVHEIISNDMPPTSPIRRMWFDIIKGEDESVKNNLSSYINAGFFAVNRKNTDFLRLYKKFIIAGEEKYGMNSNQFNFTHRTDPFFAADQDALNMAAMCTTATLSEMGPEAMDFLPGGFTMSHAIGSPKPWAKSFLKSIMKGRGPTSSDKAYWSNAAGQIMLWSSLTMKRKLLALKVSAFVNRFYKRA